MVLPATLWALDAISEREPAHWWPNGTFDDSRWEDCTWDSALTWYRLVHDPKVPATHAEGEALRARSDRGTLGGSNYEDVRLAIIRKYGWTPPLTVHTWATVRLMLTVGWAAAVSGSMAVFPSTHRLRRWDRNFAGGHAVVLVKVDTKPRYWWVDPLAPEGEYEGEWVTEDEARRFVQGFSGGHLVGKLLPPPHPVPPKLPPAVVDVDGAYFEYVIHGTRSAGYDITRQSRRGTFTALLGPSRIDITWGGKARLFAKLISGPRAGHWVNLNESTVDLASR